MKAKIVNIIVLLAINCLFTVQTVFAQSPVANFSGSQTSGCGPLLVNFQDLSTGSPTTWSWDFGNGQLSSIQNPVVSFSQPGTYTVRLIVRNSFGVDEELKIDYITVFPSPNASFKADITTSCIPATIQFTDLSTVPAGSGGIVSWFWDFGNGNTSTLQNPSNIYTSAGYYTVSLLITSGAGCKSFYSIGRYIRIISGVDVNFGFSQPGTCQAPFLINFQDQSSGPGTLSYQWNFGNGSPVSTLQNPSTTYPAAGSYAVTLNVQSSLGCVGTLTKNIAIAGKSTNFNSPSGICIGQTVTFQNNSSPPPVSSFWDFGDGTTSGQINPTKTFLTGGTFQVKLINNYGSCMDSIIKTVIVSSQPPVNFTADDSTACKAPFTVKFTDASPAASTWLWNFGDGNTSNLQNPSHTYTNGGSFNVTLTITLPGGCTNTITKTNYIKIQSIVVNISNAPAGGCIPFTFMPVPAITSVDSIISYSWDLGETGATYNTKFPTHIYNTAGNYDLTLTVTAQTGCIEKITIPNGVRTGTKPIVDFSFSPNNVCASTPVQFTDLSVTSPGAIIKWLWDFGDSTSSTLQNPIHVFEDTGTLIVNFSVSNNGCIDSAVKQIQILPPVAIFGYQVNCANRLQVTFLDSSLANIKYGPVTYEWRMGDPANTIFFGIPPPVFSYPAYGTYTATLIVTNGSCSYTRTKDVILPNEIPDFTISKSPVCKNEVFTLTATGVNPLNIKDYTWTIGSVTLSDTSSSINYSVTNYGGYDVTLLLEDVNGCTTSTTKPNFVQASGVVAKFIPDGPGACKNKTVSFTDQSILSVAPITQWNWDFGDGNQQTYTAPPFSHLYNQTGSYTVTLTVKDNAGCMDTYSLNGAVLITDPVAAFQGDTVFCPLAPAQFIDTSSGLGLMYNWSFSDGGSSTLQNPTHNFPMGDLSYTVKLKITDLVGCEDSVSKTDYIKIRSPKPAFSVVNNAGICLPLQTSFNFEGADYISLLWDFGDGATSTAKDPSHFYNSYGTFVAKLYLTGPGGCIDSAEHTITTYDPVTSTQINFNPASGCNSLTVNFDITTPPGFKYTLFFGDGSFDTSLQKTLNHFYRSPGNYTPYILMKDAFGCEVLIYGATVNVFGAIPLFDGDKREFCDNGVVNFTNFTLNNDPVISTVWDFGDGNTSTLINPSNFYADQGTYRVTLTVTTQNQCTSTFADTIRVYKTPDINITGRDTLCLNATENFNAVITLPDSTVKWNWTLGNGKSSTLQNVTTTYPATGNYTISLIASNKLGCADTATHQVNVGPLPTAIAIMDPITIISGGSADLRMNYTGAITNYNWLPTTKLDCSVCPLPTATPQFTTRYVVQLLDKYGCKGNGEITVQVICNGQNFFIPNTFSPNGDGSNDVFYLRGTGLLRVKVLRIFNRWGEVVFENREVTANNPSAGWNGTYKGKKATPDVYIYQLEIICNNGEIIKYAGNIALIL